MNDELKNKMDKLVNGLSEFGVVDYFLIVKDPDADISWSKTGPSERWSYAACREYCIEMEEDWRERRRDREY